MRPHESTVPETVEWFTPPEIFDALGLTFDLDVASPMAGPVPWVPARRFLTAADDGTTAQWSGRVWCNPPFGLPMLAFARRMAAHGDGVLLMPARTDTRAFHIAARASSVLVVPQGRLAFTRDDGYRSAAGFASVLLGFGETCGAALERSGLGLILHIDGRQSDFDVLVAEGGSEQLGLSLPDTKRSLRVAIDLDGDGELHGFPLEGVA